MSYPSHGAVPYSPALHRGIGETRLVMHTFWVGPRVIHLSVAGQFGATS